MSDVYVFMNEIEKSNILNKIGTGWPAKSQSFIQFENTCIFCIRDHIKYLYVLINVKISQIMKY